jgi:hypothetical protein
MVRFLSIILFTVLSAACIVHPAYAIKESVALMPLHTGAAAGDSAADSAVWKMRDMFAGMGRYNPLPENALSPQIAQIYTSDNNFDRERFIREKNLSLFISISIVPRGGKYLGSIEVLPAGGRVRTVNFESTIVSVVILGMEREIILLHEKKALSCAVLKQVSPGKYLLDEGDSAGLLPGIEYAGTKGECVTIIQTARNTSFAGSDSPLEGTVILKKFTDTDEYLSKNTDSVEKEIFRKYSSESTILAGIPPEKRFVESVLIINPLSNIILPGYGASLSTSYMGFKNPKYSFPGIGMTLAFEAYQLGYTSWVTDRKGNFFPWVADHDKTAQQLRYQRYLWSTLPVTWTVSFCDQLSAQYESSAILPPYFANRDSAAFFLSAVIPGGGLFYKGYRASGWSVYTAEFAAMGFYVRHKGEHKSRYGLYGAGAVKLGELACAYLLPPSYRAFRDGFGKHESSLRFTLENDEQSGREMYKLGLETCW